MLKAGEINCPGESLSGLYRHPAEHGGTMYRHASDNGLNSISTAHIMRILNKGAWQYCYTYRSPGRHSVLSAPQLLYGVPNYAVDMMLPLIQNGVWKFP